MLAAKKGKKCLFLLKKNQEIWWYFQWCLLPLTYVLKYEKYDFFLCKQNTLAYTLGKWWNTACCEEIICYFNSVVQYLAQLYLA